MQSDLIRHRREFLRNLANHAYEVMPNGFLLFAGMGAQVGGAAETTVNGADPRSDGNIVVVEGLDDMLNVYLHDGVKTGTWYCSLFSDNVSPTGPLVAVDYAGTLNELTEYNEATRPAWVEAASAGGVISNAASKANFTINATVNNWGAALLSDSAKESTAVGQKLFAAVKYAAVRALQNGDILGLQYSVTATST